MGFEAGHGGQTRGRLYPSQTHNMGGFGLGLAGYEIFFFFLI
jgi:hypothetical protein